MKERQRQVKGGSRIGGPHSRDKEKKLEKVVLTVLPGGAEHGGQAVSMTQP